MTATSDPSQRFVLPKDAPYLKNLSALWAAAPGLAAALERLEEQPSYSLEPSKSQAPTIRRHVGSRSVYLHSRHQPVDEAQRLADNVTVEGNTVFYVLGFGLGYHVHALYEKASDEAMILVFEPDLLLIRTALEQADYSEMLLKGRIHFHWELDKPRLLQRLYEFTAVMALGITPMIHQPSLQVSPDFFRQVQSWLTEFASYCRTSVTTLVTNGKKTAENISRSLPWYVAAPGVRRLHQQRKGTPAIVVSAGPSLRKNRHLLAEASKHATIIAVQTTLRPLLGLGITPDYVTCLDYHEVSTRFYEGLPGNLSTELVCEPKAHHSILNLYPGPISVIGNDFADGLLREMKLDRFGVKAGATVAHLAFYLAEHLGCSPIMFVGQDLGFSDGMCYSPGTSYDDVWRPELSEFCTVEMKQWEHIVRDRKILRQIADVQGRPMYTEDRLFAYLQQFERDFAETQATVLDCTEGGALIQGTTPMPLQEALNQFASTPLQRPAFNHAGLSFDRMPEAAACLWQRIEEATEIENISQQTLPVLQEVMDHLDDPERVNRCIARIDGMKHRISQLHDTYMLIMEVSQQSELRRFRADRMVKSSTKVGAERQRLQLQRDIENVQSVVDATREFRKLIGSVAQDIERRWSTTSRGEAA